MLTPHGSRLAKAWVISLVFHILVIILFGQVSWQRLGRSTPYIGPLKVELPPPPKISAPRLPAEEEPRETIPEPEPVKEQEKPRPQEAEKPDPARAPAKPAAAAAEAPAVREGDPEPSASPFGDAYADLFAPAGDTLPEEGRADPAAAEKSADRVSPRQYSSQGGVRFDDKETVDLPAPDSLEPSAAPGRETTDFSELDSALASRDEAPGSDPSPEGAADPDSREIIRVPGGSDEVSLNLPSSLAQRLGDNPSLALSDEVRRALGEEEHPVYQTEFGFTVTPEGIIKDLQIIDSSGNTFLDQELRKALGTGWTFRPAPGAGEAEGRVIISVKVK